jgi:hypothetical protein
MKLIHIFSALLLCSIACSTEEAEPKIEGETAQDIWTGTFRSYDSDNKNTWYHKIDFDETTETWTVYENQHEQNFPEERKLNIRVEEASKDTLVVIRLSGFSNTTYTFYVENAKRMMHYKYDKSDESDLFSLTKL